MSLKGGEKAYGNLKYLAVCYLVNYSTYFVICKLFLFYFGPRESLKDKLKKGLGIYLKRVKRQGARGKCFVVAGGLEDRSWKLEAGREPVSRRIN